MKTSVKSSETPRDWSMLAACGALFVLALVVRIVGIGWGLPSPVRWNSYHPDELQTVASVLSLDFFSGDFNPNFFNYPSVYLYLSYLAHTLAAGLGWTQPISNANAMWVLPHDIILCARVVSALLGALTVPFVFLAAREIAGFRVALLAATLMALAPGHVQHSHFATVDVPATFFVAWSLWLATRAIRPPHEYSYDATTLETAQRKRRRALLWSAFAAGLAAATKYNAVLVLAAPLTTWLLMRGEATTEPQTQNEKASSQKTSQVAPKAKSARGRAASSQDSGSGPNVVDRTGKTRLLAMLPLLLVAAAGGFVLGCPFSVLSFGEFWGDGLRGGVNGFAYELLVHPRQGSGEIFQNTGNGWWYHLAFNLPFALSGLVLCGSVLGLGAWLWSFVVAKRAPADARLHDAVDVDSAKANQRAAWPCVAFALLYFFALGFSQVRFMRYTLPLLPALCIFAALGARFLAHHVVRLAPRAARHTTGENATSVDVTRGNPISVLSGAALVVVVLIATLDVLWPLTHADPRDQAASYMSTHATEQVPALVGLADVSFPLWFYTPPLWPQNAPPGSSVSTAQALALSTRYKLAFRGMDAAELRAARPDWFLLNEFQWRDKERLRDANYTLFSQALNAQYDIQSFRNRSPFALPGRAFVPYDFLYTNPEQRVYKLRD
jgi:hypothetical protein